MRKKCHFIAYFGDFSHFFDVNRQFSPHSLILLRPLRDTSVPRDRYIGLPDCTKKMHIYVKSPSLSAYFYTKSPSLSDFSLKIFVYMQKKQYLYRRKR